MTERKDTERRTDVRTERQTQSKTKTWNITKRSKESFTLEQKKNDDQLTKSLTEQK